MVHTFIFQLHAVDVVEKQAHTLALFGLTLRHGTWDHTRSCLRPQGPDEQPDKNSYCAVISYRFQEDGTTPVPLTERQREPPLMYDCPVLLEDRNAGSTGLEEGSSGSPALFTVPLVVLAQPDVMSSAGVCLVCDSELHNAYVL